MEFVIIIVVLILILFFKVGLTIQPKPFQIPALSKIETRMMN
jgi:hypothetical protein